MRRLFLLALSLLCPTILILAQDSLSPTVRRHLLSDWENTANAPAKRLESIYLLAKSLIQTQPDSALSLSKTGMKAAQQFKRSTDFAKFLFIAGLCHHNLGNSNESLRYFSRALPYYRQWNNKEEQGFFFWNLGNTWYRNSNYSKCLESYLLSLKIRKSLRDTVGIMQCTNNIGLIYEQQSRLAQAKGYYLRTLKLARQTHNNKWIAIASFNLSNCARIGKEYGKAIKYLRQSLRIWKNAKNERFIGNCLSGFGDLYVDQANYTEALNYYQKAGNHIRSVSDKTELALWHVQMGNVYNKLRQYNTSIAYCDSAIQLRTAGPALDYERFAHEIMADSYEQTGDHRMAYIHQLNYQAITDSIHNADNSQKLSDIRIRYELERRESLLRQEAKLKSAEQQQIRNSTIGISVIVLLFAFLLINRSRLKQKNRHQHELNSLQKEQAAAVFTSQEEERKRIAQDLHDGLGQLISAAKMNLQRVPPTPAVDLIENSLELMDQASDELRNISFNLMPQGMEELGLAGTLTELISRLKRSYPVTFRLYVNGLESRILQRESEMQLYRVIQEAVTNSLRHAEATEITIQLLHDDGRLSVTIEDDGKGFDKSGQANPGMGLRNMTARAKWLNGRIAIDTQPGSGTIITLELPL